MRLRIPRQLESRQEIFGITYGQVLVLSIGFVIAGELLVFCSLSRIWAVFACLALYVTFRTINQKWGFKLISHCIRFLRLPDRLEASVYYPNPIEKPEESSSES